MSSNVAVAVEGVWKRYRRTSGRRTIKQLLVNPFGYRNHRESFWALQDLNFTLRSGETVGLIGANGSGKSTALRLVAGLGKPTRGRIDRSGEVGALLTLGESFDPLLTGRENAVTAGILAGYTRKQSTMKLDEIAAFAELDEFLDHPLRTYSDGMRVRLAFAVAISAAPEILLIDEVLAVGDLRFQSKCYERLEELQGQGTAVLFASHDEQQVRRVCDRVVWLSHGRMRAQGEPDQVYDAYRETMRAETQRRSAQMPQIGQGHDGVLRMNENRFGTLEVEIVDVRVLSAGGDVSARGDKPIEVEVDLEPRVAVDDPIVGVSLHRVRDGTKVLDVSTAADGVRLGRLKERTTVALVLDRLDVEAGTYKFDVGVYERNWGYVYDYHWQAYPVEVPARAGGTFGPPRRWLDSRYGNGNQGKE